MIDIFKVLLYEFLSLNYFFDKKKRRKYFGVLAIILISCAPSYIFFTEFLLKIFSAIKSSNQLFLYDVLITMVFSISQILVFLFGIYVVYTQLFYSKDINILLPLPFSPMKILGGKLLLLYFFDLLLTVFTAAPCLIMYFIYAKPALSVCLNALISFSLLPIIPLTLTTIICIIIINLPLVNKSQWAKFLILMIFVIAQMIVAHYFISTFNKADIKNITNILEMKSFMIQKVGSFIPGSSFAASAIVNEGIKGFGYQAINIVVISIYVAVIFLLCKRFFFIPILKGEYSKYKKTNNKFEIKERGFTASYIIKEFSCILKEPVVAMNSFGSYIFIPIIFGIQFFVYKKAGNDVKDFIDKTIGYLHNQEFAQYKPYIIVAIALGLAAFAGLTSVFGSSYSKDGKRLWIEKSIPISPLKIFMTKWTSLLLAISIFNIITLIIIASFLKLSLANILYIFILSQIIIGYHGLIGLIIDCRNPMTTWKNIVQAVKQNTNVLLSVLLTFLEILINGIILFFLYKKHFSPNAIYLIAFSYNLLLLILALLSSPRASKKLDEVCL